MRPDNGALCLLRMIYGNLAYCVFPRVILRARGFLDGVVSVFFMRHCCFSALAVGVRFGEGLIKALSEVFGFMPFYSFASPIVGGLGGGSTSWLLDVTGRTDTNLVSVWRFKEAPPLWKAMDSIYNPSCFVCGLPYDYGCRCLEYV